MKIQIMYLDWKNAKFYQGSLIWILVSGCVWVEVKNSDKFYLVEVAGLKQNVRS